MQCPIHRPAESQNWPQFGVVGNPVTLDGLAHEIAQWWDLDTMSDLCTGFIATHRPLLNRYRAGKLTDRDVFA